MGERGVGVQKQARKRRSKAQDMHNMRYQGLVEDQPAHGECYGMPASPFAECNGFVGTYLDDMSGMLAIFMTLGVLLTTFQ